MTRKRKPTTWERVYWKWVKKGADRSYAAWMADRADGAEKKKEQRGAR